MKFYQELQLNQKGSKDLLKNSASGREKLRHGFIYLFKVLLTVLFCFLFVTAYAIAFGPANSSVGVVVLLFIMVFRSADFRMTTKGSLGMLALFYGLMAVVPQLAHHFGPWPGLFLNLASVFLMAVLGCHEPRMCNHSTLVLGYLLIYGYEVHGADYVSRLLALAVGFCLTALVFWRNHRTNTCSLSPSQVLRSFRLSLERSQWQLTMALAVSLAVFISELFHMPRSMWAGIAAMSVTSLAMDVTGKRVRGRLTGNIVGGLLFMVLYFLLPQKLYDNIGILGGIGVGFSATYGWQAVFNTFGALALAAASFGLHDAVLLRVIQNVFGALLAFGIYYLIRRTASAKAAPEAEI